MRAIRYVLLAAVLLLPLAAGAACPGASTVGIEAVKGYGGPALPTDQPVVVDGVVTGAFLGRDRLNGFYLQQQGTRAPAGIFVYLPNVPPRAEKLVVPGNHLQVHARTGEFRGQIQLHRVDRLELCGRNSLPEPLAVHWPLSTRQLARLEGLLLEFPQPLTVTGNHELGRYGTLQLSAQGRLMRPTNDARPTRNPPVLELDDGSYRAFPAPIPYLNADGTRRVGSTVHGLTGILAYAFDAYRVHPLREPRFSDDNPRPGPLPAPDGLLRIAAFNVENYFITLGSRGAASRSELELQRAKLAAAVAGLNADVLALIEVENDPKALADLLSHLSQGELEYRAVGGSADRGSDAIKVALVYRPDRVRPLTELIADNHPSHNRPPLAAFFEPVDGGEAFGVVTGHFKSKTRCPSRGDIDRGQGCWNRLRTDQARALSQFLQHLSDSQDNDRLLVIGDLNSYGAEDPIRLLTDAGLIDLIAAHLPPEARYTYVFQGESGYLDHALASPALATVVSAVHLWHINADEPRFLGYDGPEQAAPLLRADSYRSSDHEPVVVDLNPARP